MFLCFENHRKHIRVLCEQKLVFFLQLVVHKVTIGSWRVIAFREPVGRLWATDRLCFCDVGQLLCISSGSSAGAKYCWCSDRLKWSKLVTRRLDFIFPGAVLPCSVYKVHSPCFSNFEASVDLAGMGQINKYVNLWTCTHTSLWQSVGRYNSCVTVCTIG